MIERIGRTMAVLINLAEYRRLKTVEAEHRAARSAARCSALIRRAGARNALDDEPAFALGLELTEEVRHPMAPVDLPRSQSGRWKMSDGRALAEIQASGLANVAR